MAPTLPKPPRRPRPAQLYGEYLPALLTALELRLPAGTPRLCVGIAIEGEDSEIWSVELDAAGLRARPEEPKEPLARLRCDWPAWNVASRDLLPRALENLDVLLREAAAAVHRDALRALALLPELSGEPGRLTLVFTDDAGDVSRFEVSLGDGTGPKAQLSLSERDLWLAVESRSTLTGLLKGRARLDGDVAWLLRLARRLEGSAS